MEYECEKEEFKRQTETMGITRKIKRGLCWYPLLVGRSYYNSLNQLVVEVIRTSMLLSSDVLFVSSNRNMMEKSII